MPNSYRNSSSSRKSATESIPPETAAPTRSPALSSSCRRIRDRKRSAREFTGTWYRTTQVVTAALQLCAGQALACHATLLNRQQRRTGARRTAEGGCPRMNQLHRRALLRDQLSDPLHEIRGRHVFRLFFPPRADVYFSRFRLFIPDYEQERNFLHSVLANLGIHLLVARIHFHAHADRLQLVCDFVGILRVALADGNHRHLHRRQPHRKRARIVLNQHAEESLD